MTDIYLKVHEGTGRLTGEHLCRSCRYGFIRTDSAGETFTCTHYDLESSARIRGKVTACNRYMNAALPSLGQMETVAWELKTDKSGKVAGFQPPKKEA